jgi:hypothetical protein
MVIVVKSDVMSAAVRICSSRDDNN